MNHFWPFVYLASYVLNLQHLSAPKCFECFLHFQHQVYSNCGVFIVICTVASVFIYHFTIITSLCPE